MDHEAAGMSRPLVDAHPAAFERSQPHIVTGVVRLPVTPAMAKNGNAEARRRALRLVPLAGLLLIGLAVRVPTLAYPLLEGAAGKQAHTAMVARNLYRGSSTWLRPMVDDVGRPGYFVKELPILPLFAAAGYGLIGRTSEPIGRLLGAVAWLAATPLLVAIVRRERGQWEGWLAGLWFVLSPMAIVYSRAFMSDSAMIARIRCDSCGRPAWRAHPTLERAAVVALAAALALLLKPHALFWLVPALVVVAHTSSQGTSDPPSRREVVGFWLALGLGAAPAAAWYWHAAAIHRVHPVLGATVATGWVDPSLWFRPALYGIVAHQLIDMVLTPLGVVLATIGILGGGRGRFDVGSAALLAWGAGVIAQSLCFGTRMFDVAARGTEYYQLAAVPVAAMLVARGATAIAARAGRRWRAGWSIAMAGLALALAASALPPTLDAIAVPERYARLLEDCAVVRSLTRPDEQILVLADRGGTVLYYCDRHWHDIHAALRDRRCCRSSAGRRRAGRSLSRGSIRELALRAVPGRRATIARAGRLSRRRVGARADESLHRDLSSPARCSHPKGCSGRAPPTEPTSRAMAERPSSKKRLAHRIKTALYRSPMLDELVDRWLDEPEAASGRARLRATLLLRLLPERRVRSSPFELRSAATTRGSILILSLVPPEDTGGGSRSAQLAAELRRRGFAIDWRWALPIFPWPAARRPRVPGVSAHHVSERVEYRSSPAPCCSRPRIRSCSPWQGRVERSVPVVYDAIDAWDGALGAGWYDRPSEDEALSRADHLIASSALLRDEIAARSGRGVELLPNAHDPRRFDASIRHARPRDVRPGEPTVGFVGALWGEWVDLELVAHVARALPRATFHLIGPTGDRQLPKAPNVFALGPKPQGEIPAYLQACEVAILPFTRDRLSVAVSPLKLFEYLAMRRPVIATDLPELANVPGVRIARTTAAFAAAIDEQGRNPSPWPEAEVGRFLASHTWAARVDRLLALLDLDGQHG
jgi:glycosyltransferase involved in cell wall biosynthesis